MADSVAAGAIVPSSLPVCDVHSQGATGNGTTDDTAAVQSCMTVLPSSGGTVFFPRGTYLVGPIAKPFGVNFRGENANESILQGKPGQDIIEWPNLSINTSGSHNGESIRDLGFSMDCSADGYPAYLRTTPNGLRIGAAAIAIPASFGTLRSFAFSNEFANLRFTCSAGSNNHAAAFYFQAGTYNYAFRDIVVNGNIDSGVVEGIPGVLPVTAVNTSINVLTVTNNNLTAGTRVALIGTNGPHPTSTTTSTQDTPPGGTAYRTLYYVINPTSTTVQLSLTSGGTPITFSSAGSGDLWIAPAGASEGCYQPAQDSFRNVVLHSGLYGVGLALVNHMETSASGISFENAGAGMWLLNWPGGCNDTYGFFSSFEGIYSESFNQNGSENHRVEWSYSKLDFFPTAAATNSATLAGDRNTIGYMSTVATVNLSGNGNVISNYQQQGAGTSLLNNTGFGNIIEMANDWGYTPGTAPQWSTPRYTRDSLVGWGAFDPDFAFRTPSEPYWGRSNLYVPGLLIKSGGGGAARSSLVTNTTDTGIPHPVYATASAAQYASGFIVNGPNETTSWLIGSNLPATKVRVSALVRTGSAVTGMVFNAYTTTGGYTSFCSRTSNYSAGVWVMTSCDADLSSKGGSNFGVSLNPISTSTNRDIAWISIVPYSDTQLTKQLTFADGTTQSTGATNFGLTTAALVTTSSASDSVTVHGMTSSGHCSLTATNATAAANIATTYISAMTANQVTITHAAVSGMMYDVMCTQN